MLSPNLSVFNERVLKDNVAITRGFYEFHLE